jgi:type VI secretion system secreted protein Hcp
MKKTFFQALLCLWLAPVAFGDNLQGFLRLDTITGGSTDTNHAGWMDVQAFSTGVSKAGVKALSGGLNFQKLLDTASPALALACGRGTNITSGRVDLAETSATLGVVFRLNLTNVVVTSVQIGGDSSSTPTESLSLQAQVISWNYTQFNPANGVALTNTRSIWDFTNNIGTYTASAPAFVSTGIRKTSGVELAWNASAGVQYRIYSVADLTQPFLPITQVTASSNGPASYIITPMAPAMFYIVEQLPAGY